MPGFLPGLPIGAVVVGGSAASNPATQLASREATTAAIWMFIRNLFTYEDQVS